MEINTRVNGKTIWPTVKVNSGMQTATITKDFGLTIKHKVKGCTLRITEVVILENGIMICNMDLVKKLGQISRIMKENIKKVQKMEKVCMFMQTEACMMVNGLTIKFKVSELILGQTKKFTLDNG